MHAALRIVTSCLVSSFVSITLVGGAIAQTSDRAAAQRIELTLGLSNNTVRAIHQDRWGFMWFGTADGLNRFDGNEFVAHYHVSTDSTSLWSNQIRAIADDERGILWVGTDSGINRFDPHLDRWSRVAQLPGIADITASGVLVWIATSSGLYRYNQSTQALTLVRRDTSADLLPSVSVCRDRLIYSGSGKVFSGSLSESSPAEIQVAGRVTSAFCVDEDRHPGAVAGVTTDLGVLIIKESGETQVLTTRQDRTALIDSHGQLWSGGPDGLFSTDLGRVSLGDSPNALSRDVWRVYEDDQNSIWIGTLGGLFRYDNTVPVFHPFGEGSSGLSSKGSTAVSAIRIEDEVAWIGTIGGGLAKLSRRDGTTLPAHETVPAGSAGDIVWGLERGDNGILWAATNNGASYLSASSGQWNRATPPRQSRNDAINVIIPDTDGGLLVGGSGLMRVPPGETKLVWISELATAGSELLRNVQTLLIDRSGRLWIGDEFSHLILGVRSTPTTTGSSEGVRLHQVRSLYPDSNFGSSQSVRDMIETSDGSLWLATGGGLTRFDPENGDATTFDVTDGLPGNNVFALLERNGILWFSTNRGLATLSLSSFEIRVVVDRQGITGGEFNRRSRFSDDDGTLYFGGLDGIVAFNPDDYLSSRFYPRVAITRVQKSTKRGFFDISAIGAMEQGVTLRPTDQSIAFNFSALDFSTPQGHSYAYRLKGANSDWTKSDRVRSIRYNGLEAGEYVFEVAIVRNRTEEPQADASVAITVLPAFHETWWFRTLALLLLFGVAYSFNRIRIRRISHLEKIRNRIAGDLHDDIGSNLSSIALLSDLVAASDQLDSSALAKLRNISTTAREMVGSLREIVWSIDPSRDRYNDLVEYLREIASSVVSGIELDFQADGHESVAGLGLEVRRSIVLMFKEILTNAVRHSQASKITVSIGLHSRAIRIIVHDNGKGFDEHNIRTGYGLRSLRQRAASTGTRLSIESSSSERTHGTTVELLVPLNKKQLGSRHA